MVLVASPTATLRQRWCAGLQPVFGADEVTDLPELEKSMPTLKPAVLLLDLALPRLGGIAGLPGVQSLSPQTRVVILTGMPRDTEGVTALKAGARGYCHRNIEPILLRKAVEVVQKDEVWATRKLIAALLEDLISVSNHRPQTSSSELDARFGSLTEREREIALMIGHGASNKEIASRLHVTERTVKAHLTAVFRKLGLSHRLRLALFVNERDSIGS